MSVTRRDLLKMAGAAGVMGMAPAIVRAQKLEKTKVQIAVGGKPLIYYLPLSIAEARGYFKDEGLDVSIADFAGGSKALQAVVGGSADIVSGAFEHTLSMQSKGQAYRAFVLQGRAPMIGVGVSKKNLPNYKSAADLKGKKIGVTAPGSSTNMVVSFFLAKHGLKASDVSIIGVGAGAGAVTALRSGQIDAISNTDPVVSMLEMPGDIQIIVDTRTLKDTKEIFGGQGAVIDLGGDPDPIVAARAFQYDELGETGAATLRQAKQLMVSANAMLSEENARHLTATLVNLEAASANMKPTLENLNGTLQQMRKLLDDRNLKNLAQATGEVGPLLADTRVLIGKMQAATDKFDIAIGDASTGGASGLMPRLNELASDFSQTSRQLSRVLRILEDTPQGLVFGAPALQPGPGEAGFAADGGK